MVGSSLRTDKIIIIIFYYGLSFPTLERLLGLHGWFVDAIKQFNEIVPLHYVPPYISYPCNAAEVNLTGLWYWLVAGDSIYFSSSLWSWLFSCFFLSCFLLSTFFAYSPVTQILCSRWSQYFQICCIWFPYLASAHQPRSNTNSLDLILVDKEMCLSVKECWLYP